MRKLWKWIGFAYELAIHSLNELRQRCDTFVGWLACLMLFVAVCTLYIICFYRLFVIYYELHPVSICRLCRFQWFIKKTNSKLFAILCFIACIVLFGSWLCTASKVHSNLFRLLIHFLKWTGCIFIIIYLLCCCFVWWISKIDFFEGSNLKMIVHFTSLSISSHFAVG